MTPSELKYNVEQAGTASHFFDRKTMAFFGDTMKNYGCLLTTITGRSHCKGGPEGPTVEEAVWALYRKNPVKHGLHKTAYFSCDTFRVVFAFE
jgi:hypothetical protein